MPAAGFIVVVAVVAVLLSGAVGHGAELLHPNWRSAEIGPGRKPSFEFDSADRMHVMGMSETFGGVVWHATAATIDGPWVPQTVATGYFYGPGDIAVDGEDRIHLAWHDHQSENPAHAVLSAGGDFLSRSTFDTFGHDGWDNALAIDRAGGVHTSSVDPLAFGASDGLQFGSYDGANWSFDANVAGSGSFMYGFNTALVIDSDNRPHVLFCRSGDWTLPGDLVHGWRDGGSWGFEIVAGGGISGRFPSLAIAADDTLHAAWLDIDEADPSYATASVRYASKASGAAAWQTEAVATLTDVRLGFSDARKSTSVALDSTGRSHIAFADRGIVRYGVREASGWQLQTVLDDRDLPYKGLVVLRLDSTGRPGIATWQPGEGGSDRVRMLRAAAVDPPQPFAISAIQWNRGNGSVTVSWPSRVGFTYWIQRSIDLIDWIDIAGSEQSGTDATLQFTETPTAGSTALWYRVVETQ